MRMRTIPSYRYVVYKMLSNFAAYQLLNILSMFTYRHVFTFNNNFFLLFETWFQNTHVYFFNRKQTHRIKYTRCPKIFLSKGLLYVLSMKRQYAYVVDLLR